MSSTATTSRVTRRRGQTRRRLLDAAFSVFAEEGFGRSTVEQICERAGYTRGAFYSNFASLEELFLAMWEQQSTRLLTDITAAVTAAIDQPGGTTLVNALSRMLDAVPVEDRWYRITAEFTAHALRNPALRTVMAAREAAIIAAILPIVEAGLARVGLRTRDPDALGRALVAVHDGTAVQCLMEPDDPRVWDNRTRLFACVLETYSERSEL